MNYLSSEELLEMRNKLGAEATRRKVAAALGVTEGTLYNWETGKRQVPTLKIDGILAAFKKLENDMGQA